MSVLIPEYDIGFGLENRDTETALRIASQFSTLEHSIRSTGDDEVRGWHQKNMDDLAMLNKRLLRVAHTP